MNIFVHNWLNIISSLGGILFLAVFFLGYSSIDNNLYQFRDDAVITMSVGKTIIDYGFVGVSPSGPIVEASSSPIQTFLYAATYLVTGVNYKTYSHWQTLIATFLIGFIFIRFFSEQLITGIVISTITAFGLTLAYPFFLWHASGMENALTHVLFLASVYVFYVFYKNGKIPYWMASIVFLATIARIDSIVHISVLLVIFSHCWYMKSRSLDGFYFSAIVLSLWSGFQFWRFLYFGDIFPNTAYAQNISVTDRIMSIASLDTKYLKQNFHLSVEIFLKQFGWLLIVLFPASFVAKRNKDYRLIAIMFAASIVTSVFNPFLFGPTRIDHARTTTQITLFVFLFISIIYYSIASPKKASLLFACSMPVVLIFYTYMEFNPYYLGWSTNIFDNDRKQFNAISKKHDLHRPTVSNPDLGVITWHKEFNVIDLGMLGSPIMAKLDTDQAMTEYYFNYGLPDIVGAHGYWIRRYCNSIFQKEQFHELYQIEGSDYDIETICKDENEKNPPMIYWVRRDIKKNSMSAERLLLTDLQEHFNIGRVEKEIDICNNTISSCRYIARTIFKFIPELREQNIFDEISTLFDDDIDKALLEGWRAPQVHQKIIQALKNKI